MHATLAKIISEFEARLVQAQEERKSDRVLPLNKVQLKILGQTALLANSEIMQRLHVARTADVDAIITGDWSARLLLKETLKAHGLVYDDLSSEVWIPPGAKFLPIYDSEVLSVLALEPLYVLLSKAIKAPQKNRILVGEAISYFGQELSNLIVQYGGKLEDFID